MASKWLKKVDKNNIAFFTHSPHKMETNPPVKHEEVLCLFKYV